MAKNNKMQVNKKATLTKKIKNCANCGKIFAPLRNELLCRDCQIKEEEREREVLDYVRDHQGASINEVMEAMGVSDRFIKNMINKGLFSNVKAQNLTYPCASCGKLINTGTYCTDCLTKLREETKKMADHMAVRVAAAQGVKVDKPMSQMSTIEKLDVQAANELESQKSKRRGIYETIVSRRDGRSIGRKRS